MKRIYFLLASLLSLAGMQPARAQKFEPVEGELYVIEDFNYRLIVDNPDHHCTLQGGHPDLLNLSFDDGSYHELFYIDGDSLSGYTIRPASRPQCYVYAVCDAAGKPKVNTCAGLGVKEVSGEPGDECVWYITRSTDLGDRRLSPKLNPNVFLSTDYFLTNHTLKHPDLRSQETGVFIIPLAMIEGYLDFRDNAYDKLVLAEVEKLKQQGVNATSWAAFRKTIDEARSKDLPGGWCRIRKSNPTDEEEGGDAGLPYLYSNIQPTANGTLYTVLGSLQMTPEDSRYIWKVSPYKKGGNWHAVLWGTSGKGFNHVGNVTQNVNDIYLFNYYDNSYEIGLYDDENAQFLGTPRLRYGQDGEENGKVSDTDWALTLHDYKQESMYYARYNFVFERVEESALPGKPYEVSVSAPGSLPDLVRVEYVGSEDFTGNHSVGNGGRFFLKSTPTTDDFRASEVEGYRCGIVVDESHVTVTYAPNDYEGKYYCIGRRAETLESGKSYAIFNTASNVDRGVRDRMALLYATETNNNVFYADQIPLQGAVVPARFAWTLTQGSAPDLWAIRSVARGGFITWKTGDAVTLKAKSADMRVTEWTAANPEWREINVKSLNDDGTFTSNSRISEANHVWVIGRTNDKTFWNGENRTTFAAWQKGHPFAFYELTEMGFPDGIDGVKTADRGHSTGTYDLQGRRVQQPRKGIYIRNGKKVVMK